MNWRHSLSVIVRERGEDLIDLNWWARTFETTAEEVGTERDRLVAERDDIDRLKNPIEAGGD